MRYDLVEPGLISIGFTNHPDFVIQKPRDITNNVDYWDGRDDSGNIAVFDEPQDILVKTERLPINLIVIQKDVTVDVPLLKSDPYVIRPLYNEITGITYTINQTADVTVSILTEDGTQVLNTLEQTNSKSAGTYTLTWDGKKTSGETIAEAGDYRIRVEAVSATGGTRIRDGNIRVLF